MEKWKTEKEKEEQMPYALFLHGIWGIGNNVMDILLREYGSCKNIYLAKGEDLALLVGEKKAGAIRTYRKEKNIWNVWNRFVQSGLTFCCVLDKRYPGKLEKIPDAPFGVYVKGRLPEENKKSVAVVGARKCSQYGAFMAAELGKGLALAGVDVISGMARGIDGISQQAAVSADGITYGVLGCGADVCYPQSNRTLYQKICETGGILSEYPPGTAPRPELFPPRNRIISALADVVVVVEAGHKSGTLITVDMALEQGREIYCVPGRTTDKLSEGCNRLIGQGAGILVSVDDFLMKFGDGKSRGKQGEIIDMCAGMYSLSAEEKKLMELLDFDPVSIEQLHMQMAACRGMGEITLQDVMELLMELVLKDKAVNVSGNYYARKQ